MGKRTTTQILIPDINNPNSFIATGAVTVTDTRTLFDAQVEALARVGNQFDTIIAAGRTIGAKTYQIDDASRSAMLQTYNAAPGVFPVTWVAIDNSTISLSQAQFQTGCQNVNAYYNAMVLNRRVHKNAIAALADIPSCDAYDVTTGWPP